MKDEFDIREDIAPERQERPEPEDDPTPAQNAPGTGSTLLRALWNEFTGTILPALVIAILIHLFLIQPTRVYGQSMEPTLHSEDRVLLDKITYHFRPPQRGDVVVLILRQDYPHLIKRIVGLPGETIAIHDGRVFIDGKPLKEPYLNHPTSGVLPPTRIPPMYYFVLGDNRGASNDSRSFGPVPRDHIVGRAIFRYWPPGAIGPLH